MFLNISLGVMMRYVEGYKDLRTSVTVFYRCWLPSEVKHVIIGVHGFVEHSGRHRHIGEEFARYGYGFCMYDLRGHGLTAKSDDERDYIDSFDHFLYDLEAFIESIVEEFRPKSVALFGHSMGGLIVLHYLARIGSYVDTVITSGVAAIIKLTHYHTYS